MKSDKSAMMRHSLLRTIAVNVYSVALNLISVRRTQQYAGSSEAVVTKLSFLNVVT